jgi:hypothetical protein
MLGDNEREQNEAIDPPDNTGGGKQSLDSDRRGSRCD